MSRCVLTGCRLVIRSENKSLWGDLHRVGDGVFVLAGNRNSNGSTAWEWVFPASIHDEPQVRLNFNADYFDRRGTCTFMVKDVEFNEAAAKRLAENVA